MHSAIFRDGDREAFESCIKVRKPGAPLEMEQDCPPKTDWLMVIILNKLTRFLSRFNTLKKSQEQHSSLPDQGEGKCSPLWQS